MPSQDFYIPLEYFYTPSKFSHAFTKLSSHRRSPPFRRFSVSSLVFKFFINFFCFFFFFVFFFILNKLNPTPVREIFPTGGSIKFCNIFFLKNIKNVLYLSLPLCIYPTFFEINFSF